MWKEISGYKYPYRINEDAQVQKLYRSEWMTMTPMYTNRMLIRMLTKEGKHKYVPLPWLMADAFMGGRKEGYAIAYRNKSRRDCSLGNLFFVPYEKCWALANHSGKSVEKVDRDGNVLELYKSISEASRKNYVSLNYVSLRCNGKVLRKNIFKFFDFTFRFEEVAQ